MRVADSSWKGVALRDHFNNDILFKPSFVCLFQMFLPSSLDLTEREKKKIIKRKKYIY